jgi:hypothetical protein
MYSIPADATTATNKGARMVENPTGAMVFHQPPARWWDNTSILDELKYNAEKFARVFKYFLYTMLIESTKICKIYLGAVSITDSAVVQEKQTTKQ